MEKNSCPYSYYFYGSDDSIDQDVIVVLPDKEMPVFQEERKRFVLNLQKMYGLSWNMTLAVIENGYIVDTIYPKSWIDRLNNALYRTYNLHTQFFPNPIRGEMQLNSLLAIYKTVRTVLSLLTRTHLRSQIRPIVNGIHDFSWKLAALRKVQFTEIQHFHQKNVPDTDVWKTISFYIGQNIAWLRDKTEIYTKKDFVKIFPELTRLIYRQQPILLSDKQILQQYFEYWREIIEKYGEYVSDNGFLSCYDERIDMKNETFLKDEIRIRKNN